MMVNVVISGLPRNVRIQRIITFLESVFEEEVNTQLLNTTNMDDGLKSITITLKSNLARRARRILNGVIFDYNKKKYPLQCWPENQYKNNAGQEDVVTHNAPSQSSSGPNDKLADVDLQIEIIKKKRDLIFEEAQLILEQKELEIMKKMSFAELGKYSKFIQARHTTVLPSLPTKSAIKKRIDANCRLPSFKAPLKVILSEMDGLLNEILKKVNRHLINPLLLSMLKKRLIYVLQGKGKLSSAEIVHLYRIKYPHRTDRSSIEHVLAKFTECLWPGRTNATVKANRNGAQNQVPVVIDITEDIPEGHRVSATVTTNDNVVSSTREIVGGIRNVMRVAI